MIKAVFFFLMDLSKMVVGITDKTCFLKDIWCGDVTLKCHCPKLCVNVK